MRSATVTGVVVGLALLAVADALATRAGLVAGVMPRSAGPFLWAASRAAGVTAFVALALDVTFGLFLSTGAADGWISRARSVDVHRWLSSVTLVLVATHALLLVGDGFVRFDVLDGLLPFVAPYRPTAVALGVFATYLAVVVQVSFQLRHRIGARTWRRLHHLTFVVFVLATAHGVLAGSDTHLGWMRGVYLAAVVVASVLLLLRGRVAWINRAQRAREHLRGPDARPMALPATRTGAR